jgi:hypothetical protein
MRQDLKVIVVGLAIFAIYLPVALFVHRDYIQAPRPHGKVVEKMINLLPDEPESYPDRYIARSYVFNVARFPDVSQLRVYEEMTPLPRENVSFTPDLGVYVIRIKISDGSDPRTNGRQYWAVADPVD